MKRHLWLVATLAVGAVLLVIVPLAGAASPVVSSFFPASGPVGTTVTITGTDFDLASGVAFNGTSAPGFTVDSPTQITATVPVGATDGPISVTNADGTGVSSSNFIVIPPPAVTGLAPTSGQVGASVTITGTNLTGATSVSFAGTAASIDTVTATSITTTVPAGATSGAVSVTTPSGTGVGPSFTVITPPTVTGVAPTSGPVGASVTITGTNLTGATAVRFGGTPATTFTVNSTTSIAATVPNGATSGTVSVTTPDGSDNGPSFTVIAPPTVTGFTPAVGTTGTPVTITGTNLTGATAVSFGGTAATTFTVNSPTSITATVPTGATSGAVSVTTPGGSDTSPASFTVDTTPPVLTVTPSGDRTVEADGPGGTSVSYAVSGSDAGLALLPSAITCAPVSGTTFPLGSSTVTCTAPDDLGNVGAVSFAVIVRDTTAPSINAPNASFTATDASGIARTDPAIAAYLAGISASDLVSSPTLTTTTPDRLLIGITTIVVTARDAAGNQSQKNVTLTVLEPGKTAPPPDFTPPGPVRNAKATAGDGKIVLTWLNPTAADLKSIRIVRTAVGADAKTTVFNGLAKTFTNTKLKNGVAYRFELVAFDKAGNSSRPVVVSRAPEAEPLALPKPGTRLVKPPLLRWARVPSASYFNVQLYRGGKKVLSAWPAVPRLQLKAGWTYDKRAYTLKPGTYTWYVWPGVGSRSAAVYGKLLGKSQFVITAPRV